MPSPTFIPVIRSSTPGDFNIGGLIQSTRTIATDVVLATILPGDTFDRARLLASGRLELGPGNGARDTFLYRSAVAALTTDGFLAMGSGQSGGAFSVFTGASKALIVGTAGGGLAVAEGANARLGTVVLVAGTATVANTSVTALTRIMLTSQVDGGTPGFLRVSARTAGTSFTITSGSAADTSTVAYHMVEPA